MMQAEQNLNSQKFNSQEFDSKTAIEQETGAASPAKASTPSRAAAAVAATEGRRSFAGYEEFFAFYLSEHSDPRNRAMHAAGTVLGLGAVAIPFAIGHPWYALLWPVVAYSFAWTGHFLIEGNKPATFGHPFWSFISDFRMLGLMLTGKLKARMARGATASERHPG